MVCVTGPQPVHLQPSPAGDQEDKASDAGTYTIDTEDSREEEMLARQQIDEVFGVTPGNLSFERPVITSPEDLDESKNDGDGSKGSADSVSPISCRS